MAASACVKALLIATPPGHECPGYMAAPDQSGLTNRRVNQPDSSGDGFRSPDTSCPGGATSANHPLGTMTPTQGVADPQSISGVLVTPLPLRPRSAPAKPHCPGGRRSS